MIVGAGPTGLSLGCQLARYGIDFVMVEKNASVTPYSKAIGVQARTLELYDQIGLAQKAIERGAITTKARLLVGGEIQGEFDFSQIGKGMSAFPFVLMLEQSKNEQLLYEYLRSQGKEVLWNNELLSFSQTNDGVKAETKDIKGDSFLIEAKYLVGCDGPKSPVRHILGLKFEGSTFERMFYVADARIDWHLSHDGLHVCLAKDAFVVFFPLRGEKRYRIVGVFPEEFAKEAGDVLYEEIEERIREQANLELDIHDVEWFSTYKVHTRHVDKFSSGRCFLAGDSAHIHSPAGAQGMNTGIQDGYNLAWKMALVLTGHADKKLLETYNEERLENAKNLLRTTDRMFQLVAGSEWLIAFLRMHVLPPVAKYISNLDSVREFVFPVISQTGINYRHSSLSQHTGDENFKVKAGDRMPYFVVGDKSIYDRLREPKFHLLVFAAEKSDDQALQAEVDRRFPGFLDFHSISLNQQLQELFDTQKDFATLLRPDNYIAFITAESPMNQVASYLNDLPYHSQS